jgi:hypothetical protein
MFIKKKKKKKLGEFCSKVVLSKVCQLSHVSYSFLLVHYALMNYTYMWFIYLKSDICKVFLFTIYA